MLDDLLVAVALMLVLEGIVPFLDPRRLRATLLMAARMNDRTLRLAGLVSMSVGVVLLYLVR